ncbi:hypothetical protein K437DRAFT_259919 [Tilletiaria anomala UBC 951]|uniref:Uncharacterized protein n=1 Tax=Tilletiaria anomala (strain ATCC 24038 / CBS 436.72 / UBC 951) TaxID=1037660 RepID=A0A066VEU6_TILAU|nr:uncharacterized protein K437DRAFT_259919 [Tilletiaria anomala UBC 951]KDN37115.1 hypothetical protein K437DRAFT_259919 [Tilletiaria anomala UBC 951]
MQAVEHSCSRSRGSGSAIDLIASPTSGTVCTATSSIPPSGGILNNAHEVPKRKIGADNKGVAAALKGMFKHSHSGKQVKVAPGSGPLGKTFERTQPLPAEKVKEIKGPEVLAFDPRAQDASIGNGIIISPTLLMKSSGSPERNQANRPSPTVASAGATDTNQLSEDGPASPNRLGSTSGEVEESLPCSTSQSESEFRDEAADRPSSTKGGNGSHTTTSGYQGGDSYGRQPSAISQTSTTISNVPATSIDSGTRRSEWPSAGASIRFCPLPVSGRLKRANSITIGVAARSHLLQSQGSARQNYAVVPPHQQQQHSWVPFEQKSPHQTQALSSPQGKDDIVGVGELMQRGAMKAWRKMRRRSASRDSSTSASAAKNSSVAAGTTIGKDDTVVGKAVENKATVAASSGKEGGADDEHEAQSGGKTPRRTASPPRLLHMPPATSAAEADGMHTPQGAVGTEDGALAHDDAIPHITRRLSTGTFLKDASLRQIQETRRRELLGDEEGMVHAHGDNGAMGPGGGDAHDATLVPEHEEHKEQRGWISGYIPRELCGLTLPGPGKFEDGLRAKAPAAVARRANSADSDQFVDVREEGSGGGAEGEEGERDDEKENDDGESDDDTNNDDETREAEKLAEQAIPIHSSKAMKTSGIEKIERRKA